MTVLLSLDPGGTTGWSTWEYTPTTPLLPLEHGMVSGGLQGFLGWWGVQIWHRGLNFDEVIAEDFVLDGRTARPDTTPLEILGALEAYAHSGSFPLARPRNVMKAHVPDALLRHHDLWWPGAGHDRDSARHAIANMKLRRHGPSIARYWGRRQEAA